MYKLILSDLDETLLVNHHVPDFNRNAISRARKKGVKFAVATGRAFNMIPEILEELGTYNQEDEYSICFNGALIVEHKDQNIIYFNGLDYNLCSKLFEYGRSLDVCVLIFTLDCCYIFHADSDEVERKTVQKAPFKIIENYDMSFLKGDQIAKILFMKRDMDFLMKLKNRMETVFENVSFAFSSNRYMEMNAKEVNKGEGLHWLCHYLGIKESETIAIGDNYNDVSMIKEAGLGCCVRSSRDDVKGISDYVCKHDYGDGAVKEVIEKFILQETTNEL